MDFFRSLFKRRREDRKVPAYDQPFAFPKVRRIIIPPKPSSMKGRSLAPRSSRTASSTRDHSNPQPDQDLSIVLFGRPVESLETQDSSAGCDSSGVRYPTVALFPSPPVSARKY
jgi:hypothetical protein